MNDGRQGFPVGLFQKESSRMCYSAHASFAASAVLSTVGAVTVTKHHATKYMLLALFPLLCAVQQAAEGVLWLNISMENLTAHIAKYVFLLFALSWPVWTSTTLLPLEEDKKRKNILTALQWAGIAIVLYMLFWLIKLGGIEARVYERHLAYTLHYPYAGFVKYIYVVCIVVPYMVTTVKRAWILGALFAAGYIYTSMGFVAREHLVSIWCFLATASSVTVYYILSAQKENEPMSSQG